MSFFSNTLIACDLRVITRPGLSSLKTWLHQMTVSKQKIPQPQTRLLPSIIS